LYQKLAAFCHKRSGLPIYFNRSLTNRENNTSGKAMKNQMSNIIKIRVLLGLIAIAALCNALPVRAGLP